MSTYEQVIKQVESVPTESIRHRLMCSQGQARAGNPNQGERIQALQDALKGRESQQVEEQPDHCDYPIDYMVARKYKQLFDSACRRGKEFNLSLGDVKRLVERKTCAYTGVKLTDKQNETNSRTIDRLDPCVGYVKGNVYAVSNRANNLKNQLFEMQGGMSRAPLAEVLKLCETIKAMGFVERD